MKTVYDVSLETDVVVHEFGWMCTWSRALPWYQLLWKCFPCGDSAFPNTDLLPDTFPHLPAAAGSCF